MQWILECRAVSLLHHTPDSELGHSATAFFHLAYIDAVVVGGDIVYGESAQGALLLHVILGTLLQSRFFHKPVGLGGNDRHFTHKHG